MSAEIRAAGGVVLRDGAILLVHRPQYDDWTLPKGKLDPGESWEDAARREVEEETGLDCEPGDEVGRSFYIDSHGRTKEVRYFRMEPDGDPEARHEVDEVRWVPLEDAPAALSYERDRELVTQVTNREGS
jgi:8-oxo-dGTP diphosphatase